MHITDSNSMATQSFLLLNLIINILFLVHVTHSNASDTTRKAYIVYMGDKPKNEAIAPDHHVNILRDIVESEINEEIKHEALLLHSYRRSFHGFAAMLTEREAQKMAGMDSVVSVFPSQTRSVKTTQSWDFLGFPENIERNMDVERETIIGIIDTGLWPESESFGDVGFGPPPKKWKGECQGNGNFTCNNKVIGARYYRHDKNFEGEIESPRDTVGHGTHTSSTVAGNIVQNVSLNGLASGVARGGVPSAHIAVYKACWGGAVEGCPDIDILAAFDDAIADGVDVISCSVGAVSPKDYCQDGASIGSFHATMKGILVSLSAGNEGPQKQTVVNFAPWQLCVAAVNTNRQFITKVQLGNGKIYEGFTPNTWDMRGLFFPLVYAGDAPNTINETLGAMASSCRNGSLDVSKIKDKIVLCDRGPKVGPRADDFDGLGIIQSGAVGVILTSTTISADFMTVPLPMATCRVGLEENTRIYQYINTTSNATATILKSEEVKDVLAPYVPSYSSRGPNSYSPNILKPDLAAPGTDILAAYPPSKNKDGYGFDTGTSMACPHVTAVAAYVKSFHPDWSPAAIRSALTTTAKPMSAQTTPDAEFAYGAGLINPSRVLNPGLVYDLDVQDYIDYLCSEGYSGKLLLEVTGVETMSCSPKSANETVNDLNYPSFALAVKDPESVKGVFHRTVTNVGSPNSKYNAKVTASNGLKVKVDPDVLSFTSIGQNQSFIVSVEGPIETSNLVSASLVWDDGVFQVRSPIVVYVTA